MADNLTKAQRTKNMRNIKSKDTWIELTVARELRKMGLRFSRNNSKINGKPDFVFRKERVVLFLDSCFWHVCRYHHNIPKSNKRYWANKLKRNKERDREVNKTLRKSGWRVLRIWEHTITKNLDNALDKIVKLLKD